MPKKIFFSFLLFFLGLSCSTNVLESENSNIDLQTFRYLHYVNFQKINSPSKVIERIIHFETLGKLAKKLGLLKDANYKKYLFTALRKRNNQACFHYWSDKLGSNFNKQDALILMKVNFNFNQVADKIIHNITKKENKFILNNLDLKVGSWPKGDITLEMLKEIATNGEWEQLLSLAKIPMKGSLDFLLNQWLCREIDNDLIEKLNPDEEILADFNHDYVADLFLKIKYGRTTDGVYPTQAIRIKFHPKELFEHFQKISYRFRDIDKVKYQLTVVKDQLNADTFIEREKKGDEFEKLANEYAINQKYKESAKPQIVLGYKENEQLISKEKRPFIERMILDSAYRNQKGPFKYKIAIGIIVFKILGIKWSASKIEYKEFREEVRQDLNKILLKKQFPIDYRDTKAELNFRRNRKVLKAYKRYKSL